MPVQGDPRLAQPDYVVGFQFARRRQLHPGGTGSGQSAQHLWGPQFEPSQYIYKFGNVPSYLAFSSKQEHPALIYLKYPAFPSPALPTKHY